MAKNEPMTPIMLRVRADQARRIKALQTKGLTTAAWMRRLIAENLPKAEKAIEGM
jgi:hypothetical protein